jgi:hypothetical protein
MRNGMIILAAIILFCAGTGDAYAYTYIYHNRTGHLIRISVQLYDDVDKTGQIEANKSYAISTKSLLKSWTAEAFLNNKWQQILNLTCDFLPFNHTFSIYVSEAKASNSTVKRSWYAINKED